MSDDIDAAVAALIVRARRAQQFYAAQSQQFIDNACLAVGWALLNPQTNHRLSAKAIEETGLGNAADKERKNHRKTLGLLRDIRGQKTRGVVFEDAARGLIEIARPVGVVAALTPSTNPLATPVNKTINALKGGNAVILAPPPKGAKVGAELLECIHAELQKISAPVDLVQMLLPPSKLATASLMKQADLVVVTGSQRNVRSAYSSGTPAIGVGAGNVSVIIDESADTTAAAEKICASKTFDNATSCSSENHLIIVDEIYAAMLESLKQAGGVLLDGADADKLAAILWQDGELNRELIARDMPVFAKRAGLELPSDVPNARFFMVEETGVGKEHPFSGEKLSLVVSLYRAADFTAAKARTAELLNHQGGGHSVGIHSTIESRPLELGLELPTCRVIVNQAHCFATGGSFDNCLPFSLSMGCGSWGGNSISDNMNFRHYINTTRIVRPIESNEPTMEDIFGEYWAHSKQ
ncbi:MAG: acylating sulfoacetaldehyde dehydrogenase [Gammaproteobacteria bacterium WSBS_2016_MAG_OTU1]